MVDEHLKNSGLRRVTVPGDGNCMFHSLAVHCSFTHIELRKAVVAFLKDHILEYSEFFDNEENIETYISTLALPGSWGDNLVLQIVAEILQCRIQVAQTHGVQGFHPSQNTAAPIWVAYNGATHYDAVVAAGSEFQHPSQESVKSIGLPKVKVSIPAEPSDVEMPVECPLPTNLNLGFCFLQKSQVFPPNRVRCLNFLLT